MSKRNLTRPIQLIVRVSAEEKEFIMKKVKQSGVSTFNIYALKMLIAGQINNIDLSHFHELAYEVNKIGVNINQIAHAANAAGNISAGEIKKLQEMMSDIWQLLKLSLSEVQSTSR